MTEELFNESYQDVIDIDEYIETIATSRTASAAASSSSFSSLMNNKDYPGVHPATTTATTATATATSSEHDHTNKNRNKTDETINNDVDVDDDSNDDDDDERKSLLLKITHENRTLRARFDDLQEQITRLEMGTTSNGGGRRRVGQDQEEGIIPSSLILNSNNDNNNSTTRGIGGAGAGAGAGNKSVSFSSDEETTDDDDDDDDDDDNHDDDNNSQKEQAPEAAAASASGRQQRSGTQSSMSDDSNNSQPQVPRRGRISRTSTRGRKMRSSHRTSQSRNQNQNQQPSSREAASRVARSITSAAAAAAATTSATSATSLQQQQHSSSNNNNSNNNDEMLDQQLPEDTFAFIYATPTCSSSFLLGWGVLTFQIVIYTLMAGNLVDMDDDGNGLEGQKENVFGIPANVSEPVWIAQVVAIIIAVIMQDDLRTGIDMLREGYTKPMQLAFPYSTGVKFAASVTTRLFAGSFGLIVNFLLIVTSETVIDLLLNFTALAFVSQLDEAGFFLSKQGFAGKDCLEHSTEITEAYYPVKRSRIQGRKTIMMIIILIIMIIAWGTVRYDQTVGRYMCTTVLIQMDDTMRPELGTFTGLYDLQTPDNGFIFQSQHVMYVDRAAGNTRFVFCEEQSYWTVQWKNNPNDDFPDDPCSDWYVRSSSTDTFDLTRTADDDWYVRDEIQRETILEPFFLHCFDCGYTYNAKAQNECTGRGTCSNAVCECDDGWYGMRCEFRTPCTNLAFDARTKGTLSREDMDVAAVLQDGFDILIDDRPTTLAELPIDTQAPIVDVYHRPVYVAYLQFGFHLIIFFTGRRWVATHTGLLPVNENGMLLQEDRDGGRHKIIDFFTNSFHGHWSWYAIEFISEPMDLGTPSDQNSPVGLRWFEAETKTHIDETEMQAVNEARPRDGRVICAVCNDEYNPCHFDGVCVDSFCACAIGAEGSLCEKSPVGNGRCDANYNIAYFEYDGGDCCDSTCESTPEYTCGEDLSGYINFGYFHCQMPPNRWQPLHNTHIDGDPLSLAGYSVALSQSGTLMAFGEPEQSRVKLFDKDGSIWVLRQTLQGIPDSNFGISLAISGGPVHWRNNPNFRAPLVMGVGVARKGEPMHVEVFRCGNDQDCNQVDQLEDVHGKLGPEAFDISNDGRVVAYGMANPGSVEVFEISGDYYEGNRTLRQMVLPSLDNSAEGQSAVWAVRLSEHGDVLAVAEELLSSHRKNVVRVYEWDGTSYNAKGEVVLETEAEILQRQLALSDDGNVVAVGQSDCPNLNIKVFAWNHNTSTWDSRGSPSLPIRRCDAGTFLAWTVALDHDGRTVFIGAYPDSDVVDAYEWTESSFIQVGNQLGGHMPGSESSLAVSSDGAHLVIGLPFAGLNEAGVVSTYSLPLSHCPGGESHHFRLSLTTDYEPKGLLWSLDDVQSVEILMTGGRYQFPVATLVEKTCLDTLACHSFTIYNTMGPFGLQRPGRYDIFLDGEDFDRNSFKGWAKRLLIGKNCLNCPTGTRMLHTMVRTCQAAEWQLVDDLGIAVVSGKTDADKPCDDPESIEHYHWEDVCINKAKCYSFMVNNTTPADQENLGLDYLLLYDEEVQILNEKDVGDSSYSNIGNCPS